MAPSSTKKRTIDRLIVRQGRALAERIAPALAARLVHRSWFRLPVTAASSRQAGASAPSIEELLGSPFEVALHGRRIRGWSWGAGPVVYLVHGWGGSLEQLTPLVTPLTRQGLQVVAFDGLSHGRSDPGAHGPRSSDAVELGRSLDAVAARFGPARAVVAHSLGGLSTLLALRDGWLGTERLVLVAPVSGVPGVVERLRAELGFGDRVERRLVALAERRTGYAVDDLELVGLAGAIERPRLLVVHDLMDREAPHAASVRLVGEWAGAELYSTAGLGHRRVLADPAVAGAVVRFVDREPVEPSLHAGEPRAPWPLGSADAPAAQVA
ncbi:alpha/beta hydrolase [Humibacillus xanthopallidus]|uniref:Serine aminopeptidase S33 family n=1 Tax=Humibacillus xanthopallidus TaxID=412689 RepID=A0A543HVN3_9MICO|nr:alpha/beta hydrolase [Humibacillus xanthopallidus]TQM62354.1 serine aminopeptidase S33 family [Humibacillus xanthopallidus]